MGKNINKRKNISYIHQWEFAEFLDKNKDVYVKHMENTSMLDALMEDSTCCDCCGKEWLSDDIIIKILT